MFIIIVKCNLGYLGEVEHIDYWPFQAAIRVETEYFYDVILGVESSLPFISES